VVYDDLYILHLSDLHIKNEGGSGANNKVVFSSALDRLIVNIEKQTKNYEKLVLVISGDTMDAGFHEDSRNVDAALLFFKALYDKIGEKVGSNIIISPGNHDKKRNDINSLVSKEHSEKGLDSKENNNFNGDAKCWWEEHQKAYKDFLDLSSKIHEIFGKKPFTNTFGVETIEHNENTICFLRLDTSWCSYTSDDRRKLRIGKYQLEKLFNEYRDIKIDFKKKNRPVCLTIAVSHHPLSWMTPDDEDECSKYFLSSELLDVDLLMCGHIHDSDIFNYFNNEHSLITLVTGMGRNNLPEQHRLNSYRYAIYSINLFRNSCDIIMWKSENGGEFLPDYSLYGASEEIVKLRYPLKIKENSAFIKLNALTSAESKHLFIDNDILALLPKVVDSISSFSNSVGMLYQNYLDDLFYKFVEMEVPNYFLGDELTEDENERVNDLALWLRKQLDGDEPPNLNEKLQNYFQTLDAIGDFKTFLQDICIKATEHLTKCFSCNVKFRFHFRYHSTTEGKDVYLKCASSDNLEVNERTKGMQEIDWDIKKSMITLAHAAGSVVFSSNKEYNETVTNWDDFITFIPRFDNYIYIAKRGRRRLGERPTLSAGISIKDTKTRQDNLVLYLLGYLGIDKVVANFIDDYINYFGIDGNKIPTQMAKLINITIERNKE